MHGDNDKIIEEEIRQLHQRLDKIEEHLFHNAVCDPLLLPRISTPSGEEQFWDISRRQHPGFIPRLRSLVPGITPGEEHLCMMIKLNMNVREMARILNIDVKSVYTSRARLKRKLPLDADTTMDQWIKKIDN